MRWIGLSGDVAGAEGSAIQTSLPVNLFVAGAWRCSSRDRTVCSDVVHYKDGSRANLPGPGEVYVDHMTFGIDNSLHTVEGVFDTPYTATATATENREGKTYAWDCCALDHCAAAE